ncbi:hypothetical protein GCK72_024241 [Caenorhabditis remanei]|uniref:Uncharacterized protein n=1 Tax=Caenorhabditis remanei TaxID=31234 RepID=A0A6A5FZ94_CAERE|nr:hypothetical protein GCK72_024241 [Caenorhabditis remanei]KAF1747775.1 hypothetical protein GCK72_024241 [Caenorhabditis remanei]
MTYSYTNPPAFKDLVRLLPPTSKVTIVETDVPLSYKIFEILISLGVFVVAFCLVALVMYLCTRPATSFLGRIFFWDHVEEAVEPAAANANEQFVQIVLNDDVEGTHQPPPTA